MASKFPGLGQALTHNQRVTRLYRAVLANLLSVVGGDRSLFIQVGREIQAEFRKNKDIKDPFLVEKLVKEAEKIHADWIHPQPIVRFKHEKDFGNVYQRNTPPPLEACTPEPPWAKSYDQWWQDVNHDLKAEAGQNDPRYVWRTSTAQYKFDDHRTPEQIQREASNIAAAEKEAAESHSHSSHGHH
eukprot:TRINITY_DN2739_c0_g1::TRINITY_DN2739_c0_g1_i1::g.27609::m.27609 TRINITY_DN2739_c0_g1::TRINITY_DN2739_c0_g1_i1::g.27609  ORF type:complete len:198 (-),score=19.67,sp/Q54NR3/NDUB9_DICDI/29.59/8e-09,Complex1_LYR/PF05347.10/3.3e-06,Complex1_LYR/PF05347.10/2.9e+02,Complex1_LYR_1/PF13232.1/5.3e-06,Complex1_LYR_1/PF13232.1/2.9e+03 TRINITY_DN2739_c0_g1_i1:346-903(-)